MTASTPRSGWVPLSAEVIALAVRWYLRLGCPTQSRNYSPNAPSRWTSLSVYRGAAVALPVKRQRDQALDGAPLAGIAESS
jgi:hypothetical protein